MDVLKIEAKYDTPKVILDKSSGTFEISGRSIPEDAIEFYQPVLKWIEQYAKVSNPTTRFTFRLDYVNTASTRMIHQMILTLISITGMTIEWLFKEDDQDMEEVGQDFSQLVGFPIEIKPY
jgi:hypothetical protein